MAPSQRPAHLTVLASPQAQDRQAVPPGLAEFIADERTTYTVAEAAALLGISKSTAYECAQTGQLPVLRLGRRLLVTRTALLHLLGVDTLLANLASNERERPRRTRWRRMPESPGQDDPVPDWARPHRRPSTE